MAYDKFVSSRELRNIREAEGGKNVQITLIRTNKKRIKEI